MKETENILLVEDDDVDAMTVKRAFKEIGLNNPFHREENGEDALTYLRDKNNPTPGLILLDINMPRMNGIEFLTIAKADEALKKIPVVILTTSKEDQDRIETFSLSVAGYMLKPVDYRQFVETIRKIKEYWIISESPSGSE